MKTRKKLCSFFILTILLCSLTACGAVEFSGTSAVFSQEDLQSAADVVYSHTKNMVGVKTVLSLKYAGDETQTPDNDAYCHSLSENTDEYIVFEVSFLTGSHTNSLNTNQIYTGWTYYLGKTANGSWQVLTSGYA